MNVVGDYNVSYQASDSSGNTGYANRTIYVRDTTDPVITLSGSNPYTVERGGTYSDPGWSVDTGESVTMDTTGLNMSVSGTYTVTYTATDSSGNIGTASRTVTVEDTAAPVITLSGSNPYQVEKGDSYNEPGWSVDTGENVTNNASTAVNMNVIGNYTVTYSATDADNNTGYAYRTVHVRDTTAPKITLQGANPYYMYIYATYNDPGWTVDTGETVTHDASTAINRLWPGTYTVTYQATDASNNTGYAYRNVIVQLPPPPPPPPPGSGCFDPTTSLRMLDGTLRTMEELLIGDVLYGGITVNAVVKILNVNDTPYYKIHNSELDEPIYVTGSHRVKEDDGTFVEVSEYSKAELTDLVSRMWICLITDNHVIPMGEHTFWDWADTCDICEKPTI